MYHPVMTDMTVAEVATACGVTERTVRRWLRDGRLPALRVGGRIRIPEHALRELTAPYGSDREPSGPPRAALGPHLGADPGLARAQRAARAERLLAMVRSLATPAEGDDGAALVRAGRDEQDDRWDRA
jgi:excisionase family DNA binding protein